MHLRDTHLSEIGFESQKRVGGSQRTLSMSRVSAIQTANAARTGALTTSTGRIVSGSINSKYSSFISGACCETAAARHLMAAVSRSPQAMDCWAASSPFRYRARTRAVSNVIAGFVNSSQVRRVLAPSILRRLAAERSSRRPSAVPPPVAGNLFRRRKQREAARSATVSGRQSRLHESGPAGSDRTVFRHFPYLDERPLRLRIHLVVRRSEYVIDALCRAEGGIILQHARIEIVIAGSGRTAVIAVQNTASRCRGLLKVRVLRAL